MEFKDLLNDRIVELKESFFILENLNSPIIISIPHSSRFVLEKFYDYRKFNSKILMDTDIGTEELFNFDFTNQIIGFCNPYFVNYSRPRDSFNDSRGVLNWKFLNGESILKKEYSKIEIRKILSDFYDDYHKKLSELIDKVKEKFGYVLLIDGHGMAKESIVDGTIRDDFCFGTLDGKSINKEIKEVICNEMSKSKYKFNFDSPYSGGFITQKYSNLKNNIFVLQIETVKENYINNNLKEKYSFNENFEDFKQVLEKLILKIEIKLIAKFES